MISRFTLLLAGLALLALLPATASAQTGRKPPPRTYKATLEPVRADVRNYSDTSARATLRFRNRQGRIDIVAKALAPRRSFPWAITARRCGGPRVLKWRYKRLRSGRGGRADATGSGRRFPITARSRRYVVVYQPNRRNVPLLCGRLRLKQAS